MLCVNTIRQVSLNYRINSSIYVTQEAVTPVYAFRPYVQDDLNFIQSSWGVSYYDGVNGHHQLSPDEFHAYHRPIRDRILSNPNVAIIICHASNDPNHIIGWIVVEKPTRGNYLLCHYVYTKATFAGNGIANELIKMALPIRPVLFTHSTIKSKRIIKENWKSGKNSYSRWHQCPMLV